MGSIASDTPAYRLAGKVALVTGSSRGIGAAIAIELAKCGAKIVVNYSSSEAAAQKVVRDIKELGSDAIAIKANVNVVSETERMFKEALSYYGKLDIVSSNAGVVSFGHLEEVTEDEFDRVFTLNTRGQFFVAREAYKNLVEGGRIILTSSNTASTFVVPRHSVYSGSKGAIESFVPVLAKDCGKKKITVNAVAPGGIVTDMFDATAKEYMPNTDDWTPEQLKEGLAHASPLHRCAYPVDVARVVCFLASEEGGWINGKTIGVDGGAA